MDRVCIYLLIIKYRLLSPFYVIILNRTRTNSQWRIILHNNWTNYLFLFNVNHSDNWNVYIVGLNEKKWYKWLKKTFLQKFRFRKDFKKVLYIIIYRIHWILVSVKCEEKIHKVLLTTLKLTLLLGLVHLRTFTVTHGIKMYFFIWSVYSTLLHVIVFRV